MKHLIWLLMLLLSYHASSQTHLIKGKVYDKITMASVEYANIIFLRSDSSFIGGTLSDSTGNFEFRVPPFSDKLLIQITNLNYQKKQISFSSLPDQFLKIALIPSVQQLGEIVVKSNLKMVKSSLLQTSYLITDQMRKEALLATQLLEGLPNIYVDFNNTIFINGNSNVLVLKDGIEISSQNLINQISPQAIERIEVSKTVPTKYLTRKYSSTLNIITKRIYKKSILVSGNISPTNNLYDASTNLNIEQGKHTFYLYYNYYYRNFKGENKLTDIGDPSHPADLYKYMIKPRKEQDNEIFTGYSFYPGKKYKMGFDGYLSFYDEHQLTKTDKDFFSDYKDKFKTQNYRLYLQRKDSVSQLYSEISYTYKDIKDKIFYQNTVSPTMQNEDQHKLNDKLGYSIKLKNFTFNTGFDYNYLYNTNKYNNNNSLTNQKYKENNFSAYADLTKEFEKLSLNAGVNIYTYLRKIEDTEVKSFNFYPKISIMYQINENNAIKIDYSSFLGNPTIWQMLSLPVKLSPTLYLQGNPYLKPEVYNNLLSEFSYSKGKTYLSGGFYYTFTRNKIQEQIVEDKNQIITYINLNKRYDYGLNLSLNFNLTNFLKIRIYGDLFYRNIPNNGYSQKWMPTFNGSLLSSWTIAQKITLAMRYQYNGEILVYNGKLKNPNTSIAQLRYTISNKLSTSLLMTQPMDVFKTKSTNYNTPEKYILRESKINVRALLFSLTYIIFNENTQKHNKIYYNEDKKY